MPVTSKLLQGVIMGQHAHTIEDRKRAVDAGAQSYREGKAVADCPDEFLPKMGDSCLYDHWVMGFRGAALADGGGGVD